ncbi:MAG: MOSC domain-containing protein [Acidobacteria bacterium]|nr:MOSC domain-containing protein [Acidobacteriota bacterium]
MGGYNLLSLWRYPVKSMAGEELDAVEVTARGLTGDRAYALVDTATKKVGSAKSVKKFGALLQCRAQFVAPPQPAERPPAVRITLPNGAVLLSDQPDSATALAAAFGPQVSLASTAPEGLMLEFAAGTLGGKHAETTEAPLSGAAPPGTFFDLACVHLLTTATLRRLQEAYPEGQFAVQRFRPNLVVDCADESGFVENSWVGRTVSVGADLVLHVSVPCARCVMTTLPRAELPHDPGILRTAVQQNRLDLGEFGRLPCVGVYADVVKPGRIGRGDPVRLLD